MRIWIAAILPGLAVCLFAQEAPQSPEYGGPSVLSRGGGASVNARSDAIRFRPYLSLNGVFDSGLAGVSVSPDGELNSVDSFGAEATAGVYGHRDWKRTSVGLDYRGAYRHYTPHTYFDGTDQMLALVVTHQPTRHTTLTLREAAGTFTRSMGLAAAYSLIDPLFANVPQDQLFDGRVNFMATMGDLTYQKSARTSFNMGGDQFLVRYRSSALTGVTGARARSDVAYRYSRHGTIGLAYSFNHFAFKRAFGASDAHTLGIQHSVRLSRFWEWRLRVGGSRVETLGVARVNLDPVIAAIIGQSFGIMAIHRVNYVPDVEAKLSRGFRRASLEFSYSRGISPGNGLFLTSVSERIGAEFHYTGLRKWNFGLNSGYSSFSSLTYTLGKYRSYTGGGGATYEVLRHVHLNLRLDARKYLIDSTTSLPNFDRVFYRATVGVAFSPGEVPLSLW